MEICEQFSKLNRKTSGLHFYWTWCSYFNYVNSQLELTVLKRQKRFSISEVSTVIITTVSLRSTMFCARKNVRNNTPDYARRQTTLLAYAVQKTEE